MSTPASNICLTRTKDDGRARKDNCVPLTPNQINLAAMAKDSEIVFVKEPEVCRMCYGAGGMMTPAYDEAGLAFVTRWCPCDCRKKKRGRVTFSSNVC